LGNYLLAPGEPTPTSCAGSDPARLDCTANHVSDIEVAKTSAPRSNGKVEVGDRVTYTLTLENVGRDPDAEATPVDQVDDLSDVLDDASWASGPTTGSDTLSAKRSGDELRVTGALAPGQKVTVKYAVTVTGDGNGRIRNAVSPRGEDAVCAKSSPTCTSHAVSPQSAEGDGDDGDDDDQPDGGLPDTGSPFGPWLPALGLLSLLLGAALVVRQHRRDRVRDGG